MCIFEGFILIYAPNTVTGRALEEYTPFAQAINKVACTHTRASMIVMRLSKETGENPYTPIAYYVYTYFNAS